MFRLLPHFLIVFVVCFPLAASAQTSAAGFNDWRNAFRETAIAAGISPSDFKRAFRGVRYTSRTQENDQNQPEFARPIWIYLDEAISADRIRTGRAKAGTQRGLLREIERKYRVDSEILLAIWGIETNFGSFRGSTYTVEALANTAYLGRRRAFAEAELIAAMKILARGDISAAKMLGGWSGAMGHTQFMPSTYLRYGVDQTKSGRSNIWSNNPADALASTANYLQQLGWTQNQPWGVEVSVPIGFNFALTGEYDTHRADFWNARGVRTVSGERLPNHGEIAILVPAGANGPIFAIFPNFQIIREYNKSVFYSLAVGRLSERIGGGKALSATWPRKDPPMTREDHREIQELLSERGFNVGEIDGMIGPRSIDAIQAFQISVGLKADGYASIDLLERLRQ